MSQNKAQLQLPLFPKSILYLWHGNSFVFQLSAGGFGYSFSDSANRTLNSSGTIVATLAPAVPEPSTWAMMILGFCGLGFMVYRLKQNGSAFSLA
jgi:hypothetical protein